MRATKLLGALLIAATFCITTDADAADHLTPCTDGLKEYYAQVETLMRQAAPDDALWKVTVFPPSQPEWSIRATRLDDGYELTVVRFDRSLWDAGWITTRRNELRHDPSIARAQPRATTHKISARLFSELEAEIRRSTEAARPNENILDDIVLDSVIFRFEVADSGCGEAHTLDRTTRTGKLVAIVLALCNPPGEDAIFRWLDELRR
jgi:hypothetical protein